MARIVNIEIHNFRSIASLSWQPGAGVNCLIGPGDSGKSSILDAIDFALGARRNLQFSDADFHQLDVSAPILIELTIGGLDDALKSMDSYGQYLRGFDELFGELHDEPGKGLETVLTLRLTVASDLEPNWALHSDRAAALGQSRNLAWSDRTRLAPTRIGALTDQHLAWRRGSVLNQLSDERADASAAMVAAAREARNAFGDAAQEQLAGTLKIVAETAAELGIPIGAELRAMLDAHSISFTGGTIALHGEDGVPARALGLGSTRLLIAGLQRKAAKRSSILLIDELEHGLEPHRIIRLLDSIGAKEKQPPLQAFVTTHSPVALRELSGSQLYVLRSDGATHRAALVGTDDEVQSTIRVHPEAFLAAKVVVCEGASEVGLLRGLDWFTVDAGKRSLTAHGVALVNAGGCKEIYRRAEAFQRLGYRTAVLRDDDVAPDAAAEAKFVAASGKLVHWQAERALEDELFLSLPDAGVLALLERAIELHGEALVEAHLRSASGNAIGIADCRADCSPANRALLGKASRSKNLGWFKTVGWMTDVGHDIVGPHFKGADKAFKEQVNGLFVWMRDAGR